MKMGGLGYKGEREEKGDGWGKVFGEILDFFVPAVLRVRAVVLRPHTHAWRCA